MTEKGRRGRVKREGGEGTEKGRKIMEGGRKGDDGGKRSGR